MLVRRTLDWRLVIRIAWRRLLVMAMLGSAVRILELPSDHPFVAGVGSIVGSLGTAVSILIGFRVNAAYERWWEARKVWGALVNESRTFARQVVSLLSAHFHPDRDGATIEGTRRELILGQAGLAYALKNHLRRNSDSQKSELVSFFPSGALEQFLTSSHVPLAILMWLARRLQTAFEDRHTEDFRHMQIDATLNRITDAVGAMDRIKSTVFPRQYAVYANMFTALFAYLLPVALVPVGGWPMLPLVVAVGFIFFALDSIAGAIENPFDNTYNDTPMLALSRSIEIQLREALGERDLPAPVEPVNGVLW
ncbi:MAG: bestrophin family ion channel [bacterium]|nr:bestrophin family ion channel [bacterium]